MHACIVDLSIFRAFSNLLDVLMLNNSKAKASFTAALFIRYNLNCKNVRAKMNCNWYWMETIVLYWQLNVDMHHNHIHILVHYIQFIFCCENLSLLLAHFQWHKLLLLVSLFFVFISFCLLRFDRNKANSKCKPR